RALPAGRLLRMGPVEFAFRSRQEAAKVVDRLLPSAQYHEAAVVLAQKAPALAGEDAALRLLRSSLPARIFAGVADHPSVEVFSAGRRDEGRDLIAAATDIVAGHRVDLLGYKAIPLNDPIDWHLDWISGRRSPFLHWSLIDPLDRSTVGDSKVVWELNRHQWI